MGRISLRIDASPVSCSVSDTISMPASSRVARARKQSNMLRAMREIAHTYSLSMGALFDDLLPLRRIASRWSSARRMRPR